MTTGGSAPITGDRRFYGVAEAVVKEVNDEKGRGRVKVRLPWFDQNELTDWIRIANPFAGSGHGSTWVPEKEAEVLVGFVHGDLRFPVVLGCLYNARDKPPSVRTDTVNQKMFRTKAGHEVTLDDSPDALGILVRTKAGHRIHVDDAKNELTLSISGGPSITLAQQSGSIVIKATSITLDAQTLTLKASQGLTATGRPIRLN